MNTDTCKIEGIILEPLSDRDETNTLLYGSQEVEKRLEEKRQRLRQEIKNDSPLLTEDEVADVMRVSKKRLQNMRCRSVSRSGRFALQIQPLRIAGLRGVRYRREQIIDAIARAELESEACLVHKCR